MTANDWELDSPSASKIHRPPSVVPAVNDSWTRCRGFGLSASAKPAELVLSEEKFKDVLDQNETIRHLVLPELELLYNQIAGTNFMVAYADGGGVVLDSIQDHNFRAGEGGKTVIPGSVWVEKHRGTNALYQAIHTREPAIVTGRDHFFHKLSDLSCFAAPIFDHEMQLVGVIDATSNAKARNEHTLALVKLAACNVENRMFTEHFCDSLILMFHARHEYLPTTSVAMIAVDDYGFIEGANSNAKSVLSGLDIGRKQHFGEVFDVQFFDIVDQVRSNDIISIRDRMGAVVFMKAQQPISRRVVNVEGDLIINKGEARVLGSANASNSTDLPKKRRQTKPICIFEDEVLVKEIASAARAMALGLPITIVGKHSTGKTEIAREIKKQAFGDIALTIIDCHLLTADNYEAYLFGETGKISFFDRDTQAATKGKLFLARGGAVFFKNAHTLTIEIQEVIAAAISYEDEELQVDERPSIRGWLFSGPLGWEQSAEFDFSKRFANAIGGRQLTAPNLSQRTDFEKVALAILNSNTSEHILSPAALKILKAERWPGNFIQLKKTIRHAVANSTGKVIRQEIQEVLKSFIEDGIKPCPHCVGSPMREETCIMIQRCWTETGGNVSLVARRLGVSRNTVYKHVPKV